MHTFISGGCKNGKSSYAQELAKAAGTPLYYVATMVSTGAEDDMRIARHIRARAGWGFETVECARSITDVLKRTDPSGSFLLDSVTALLANEMFPPQGGMDTEAPARVARELETFLRATRHAVLVSDYIYADAADYDACTEAYRRGLAEVDRAMAAACDCVIELSAGMVCVRKGERTL